jgi:gamma-glutamylcyclotransferase (GGCT)/AIG2-like uncharacterized protein YtfP
MNLPLFVYGTLRSDAPQAALLAGLPRRPATTTGRLYRLPAGYPALVPGTEGVVAGELVANASDRLAVLDRYEGVSEGLYQRVVIPVRSQGTMLEAWAYTMPAAPARGGRAVRSGRWTP